MISRSPRVAAIIGLTVLALLVLAVARLDSLPLIGKDRRDFRAEFSDAGGIKPGSQVQVAGVRAGTVTDIEIGTDQVVVVFELDAGIAVGDRTTAAVAAADLLGSKYLDVRPAGTKDLEPGGTIPLARTVPSYDVVDAFEDLTSTTQRIDTDQLAGALDTLADTFRNSPPEVKAALGGLSRFSRTIASRDRELRSLLDHAETTTGVLDARRGNLSSLVRSTSVLFGELIKRRDVIRRLLASTSELSSALRGVVRDNQATLDPALRHLDGVTSLLRSRRDDIRLALRNLRAYASYFVNVVGTGPWFDNVIPRLPDTVEVTQR